MGDEGGEREREREDYVRRKLMAMFRARTL